MDRDDLRRLVESRLTPAHRTPAKAAWPRIEALLAAALDLPPEARESFLDSACAEDPVLRAEVAALVTASEQPGLVDTPVAALTGLLAQLDPPTLLLEPGTRLGPYVIVAQLGAGGMGQVYRARDTRLDRDVAIKIVAPHLQRDATSRQRLEREARVIASLTHPNILAIFDIGDHDGLLYVVTELLTGHTLREMLQSGRLEEHAVVDIGTQVARGLGAAHSRHVVHRDLKPENLFVTQEGVVKILDFGLAKPHQIDANRKTVSITLPHTVLGTIGYMSPEQITGDTIDVRSDLFSLGAVMYEAATGVPAFSGSTRSEIAAAILSSPPLWSDPGSVSPTLAQTIARCLAKSPGDRYQSAADLAFTLQLLGQSAGHDALLPKGISTADGRWDRARTRLGWVTSAVLAVVAVATGTVAILHLRESSTVPEPITFTISAPPGAALVGMGVPIFALSPDGGQIVFRAGNRLWLRRFSSPVVDAIPNTEGANSPFWAPDGRSIAFFAAGKLKKMQLSGGLPIDLCDVSIGRGGAWNRNNDIIFATVGGPIQKVSSSGGPPTPVTTLDTSRGDVWHLRPQFFPDGRHFLFVATGGAMEIRVASLDTTEVLTLTPSDTGGVYAAGHLLFVRGGNLLAQPMDPGTSRLTGEPVSIAAEVWPPAGHDFQLPFALSDTGVLAYAAYVPELSWLTWFDRSGKKLGTIGEAGNYRQMTLSPDGQRIAVALGSGSPDIVSIWVIDAVRGLPTRVTFGPGSDSLPLWSPDGTQLAYNSLRDRPQNLLLRRPSNAGGHEELLMKSELATWLNGWSHDGQFIVYTSDSVETGADLRILRLEGDRGSEIFLQTPSTEQGGAFSPDGRWIAYMSNTGGRPEVFVRPFPATSEQYQISRDGGSNPMWRADGRELYFAAQKVLMVADIDTNAGFDVSNVRKLFPIPSMRSGWHQYDVTRDGSRFLAIVPEAQATPPSITVVLNWPSLLKHK